MRTMLLRNIVRPLIERVGTMVAAYLIARGMDTDHVAQLINAVVAALFIGLDLLVASFGRKAAAEPVEDAR